MPTKLIAADASAGAILDPSIGDGILIIQTGPAGAKVNAISIAADGTPTFLKVPANTSVQSMVRVHTAGTTTAGYGTTNTSVRRWTTVATNQGTDITYADSVANGASFTINTSGVYGIEAHDCFSAANTFAISLNSVITMASLPNANILAVATANGAGITGCCACTVFLTAGDVIRVNTQGQASSTSQQGFTITRVA